MAAYSFDASSADDDSGRGHTGTLVNTPTFPAGHSNAGLGLAAASNQTVSIADHVDFTFTSAWTVMAWVKFATILVASVAPKPNQWWLGHDGSNVFTHGFYFSGGGSSSGALSAATVTNTGTWYHVAGRYDGSTLDVVLNGSASGGTPVSVTNTMADTTDAIYLGSWLGGAEYLDGVLDDVRIFNSWLTEAEITTYMNTPVGGTGTPPTVRTLSSPLRW